MLMRYHLGLAVGHTYAKASTQEAGTTNRTTNLNETESLDEEPTDPLPFISSNTMTADTDWSSGDEEQSSDSEMDWEDWDQNYSDQELLEMDEMYEI
jgi:hypothetical protein